MKTIPLTQGQEAIVDDEDFEALSRYKWTAWWNPSSKSYYAYRMPTVNGRRVRVTMHRQLLGLSHGDRLQGDHINRNTLDNRKRNLRIATASQNGMNRTKNGNNTSGFKGVVKCYKKWQAVIIVNRKRITLGLHDTPELA